MLEIEVLSIKRGATELKMYYFAQIEKEQFKGELRDISRKSPLKGVSRPCQVSQLVYVMISSHVTR